MIIVLRPGTSPKEISHLVKKIKKLGLKPWISKGKERTIIGVIGEEDAIRLQPLEAFPGVEKVLPILKPFKLASRDFSKESTVVDIGGGIRVGGEKLVIMAGPCSVETLPRLIEIAHKVKAAGAQVLRGGAFKPRTSPYSFQGLGVKGLKFLAKARDETGLKVVTELMDIRDIDVVLKYADVIQIGARNMQNFNLLREVGKTRKPVLLKRGMSSTIKEFLMSAEYILSEGNFKVILCERGIRTFDDETRFTFDVNAIPVVKGLTHLPIIADPSHAGGKWNIVAPCARAAIAAGADGLIVEVHTNPEEAFSDGEQSLLPEKFSSMMREVASIAEAVGRYM